MSELGPRTLFLGNHAELARLLLLVVHEKSAEGSSKSPSLGTLIASLKFSTSSSFSPCTPVAKHPTPLLSCESGCSGSWSWWSLVSKFPFLRCLGMRGHKTTFYCQFNMYVSNLG